MAQGSSASPGWFVKVTNEVIKGLEKVAAHHHHGIVFDPDPTAHVKAICTLFERLLNYNLKFSPSKPRHWATDAAFFATPFRPPVCARMLTKFPP